MMVTADSSWWSLTCTPVPSLEARLRLEDILYSADCGGIWDHTSNNGRERACSEHFEASLLTAYFPGQAQPYLKEISRQLEIEKLVSGRPQIQVVENEDWLDGWRKNFTLTELTERALVVPSWQDLPAAETRLGIRI